MRLNQMDGLVLRPAKLVHQKVIGGTVRIIELYGSLKYFVSIGTKVKHVGQRLTTMHIMSTQDQRN